MDDLLNRARAMRTLVGLAEIEPATMRQFMEISGYVWESADALLNDLEADGLIRVEERKEGTVRKKEIWLTEDAREIVKHGAAVDELHKRARDRKSRAKSR